MFEIHSNLSKFLLHDKSIRGYSSLEEMLYKEKNFDGISNTTPDRFHKTQLCLLHNLQESRMQIHHTLRSVL